MPALRVCSTPGCPTLYPKSEGQRCKTHRAQAAKARGTRTERGYNQAHITLRSKHAPQVATGTVKCWRCGELIARGTPWDLGHSDDGTTTNGPEHRTCNRRAAGRKSHT